MLTLICGLPRAGKTTYSKQFENDGRYKVIHLDTCGTRKVNRYIGANTKIETY